MIRPYSIYEHYAHRSSAFDRISIYEYLRFVSIVKRSQQQGGDYEFADSHRQKEDFVQRPLKHIEQLALVVLRGKLSENEELEDAIPGGHPETDARRTDLSLILLSLFVPWNHLSSVFLAKGAILETYKEFCWRVWVKCEPKLPPYVRFYANNVCQMRKTRIEVRADIAARADAREAARLAVDDWCDETTDMVDSDREAEIDPTNMGLAEFGVQTKTFLADSVRETRRKWAIDDFTKCSDNNLITSLIMNIGAESATHMEESLTICRCQVDELDRPERGDSDHVSEDVVSL